MPYSEARVRNGFLTRVLQEKWHILREHIKKDRNMRIRKKVVQMVRIMALDPYKIAKMIVYYCHISYYNLVLSSMDEIFLEVIFYLVSMQTTLSPSAVCS